MRKSGDGSASRRAFTLVEALIAVVVVGIIAAIAFPRFADEARRAREVSAANVIAADLELAGTLAATHRRPVRLRWMPARNAYEIALRDSAVVFLTRSLGSQSEWRLQTVSFSPQQVDFFPGGVLSSSLRVGFSVGPRRGQVYVTRAGLVQVTP
jgi:prepilin-type N-terminal cleavage/methylation domain-containing protein